MTDREKVIRGLEWCLFETGCDGCPYRNDCDDGTNMEKDALALLKAQEPQLVIRSSDYIEGTVLRCPKCKEVVYKYNGNYCSHCGQAVKWK